MSPWTKTWRWLLVAILAIVGVMSAIAFFDKRSGGAFLRMWQEIDSIRAEEDAGIIEASEGHAEALAAVERTFETELAEMELKSAERVAELRKDPKKLARSLARRGRPL